MVTLATPLLPASLPMPRTRLFGREVERASGRSFLLDDAVPLLTLTGPGGVGKTRLALTIASDVRSTFADGVVFVDLAPIVDPGLVAATVSVALQAFPTPDQSFVAALAAHLRERHLLLLLDNCEHLLPETADLVATLLSHCAMLHVLATSRAALRLRAEQVFAVEPLPAPTANATAASLRGNDAVKLFVDRARAVRPAFVLDGKTAVMVGDLCRQLDGLPLAIELAAARSAILSPQELLSQMQDRLHWLSDGPRDLPARQQTIRDMIAWSYELLPPETQRLFRLLSTFAGGITLESARRVIHGIAPGCNVPSGVRLLVENGLLGRTGPEQAPRFLMLETIRAFGRERLMASGEADAAGAAHAAAFLAFAADLHPNRIAAQERVEERVQRLEADLENVRAALVWFAAHGDAENLLRLSASLGVYWHLRTHFREGRLWLERALAATPPTPTLPRGQALAGLALILWAQSHYADATAAAQEALSIADQHADVELAANALHVLGMAAEIQDQWQEAADHLTLACERWRALGAKTEEAWALTLLCRVASALGQSTLATQHAEQALLLFREVGHPIGIATALSRLGEQARGRGEDYRAAAAYQEALCIYAKTGENWLITLPLAGLADLAAAHDQVPTATALVAYLDALAAETGAPLLSAARLSRDRAARGAAAHQGDDPIASLQVAGRALTREGAVAAAATVTVPQRFDHRRAGLPGLTAREREILRLMAAMHTDQEIATALSLSRRTVSGHVTHILDKLDVATRRAAVARGRALGLLPDPASSR